MLNFKKAAAGSAAIAILLTGCLGGGLSVIDYNNEMMAGLNSINEAISETLDSVTEEDANADSVIEVLNVKADEVKSAADGIRGLAVPEGEGVKEFSDEAGKFATGAEEFMGIMKQYMDAVKNENRSEVEKFTGMLKPKSSALAKIYGNIGVKQKEMAKKNNFELKQGE